MRYSLGAMLLERGLPLHAHPMESSVLHGLASNFGKGVACGFIDKKWALDCLVLKAKRDGYQGSLDSYRVSLSWTIRDAAYDWQRQAGRAETAIRKSVAPLFDAKATTQAIEEAAYAEHRRFDCPLAIGEVEPILVDELRWWRMRSQRRR